MLAWHYWQIQDLKRSLGNVKIRPVGSHIEIMENTKKKYNTNHITVITKLLVFFQFISMSTTSDSCPGFTILTIMISWLETENGKSTFFWLAVESFF